MIEFLSMTCRQAGDFLNASILPVVRTFGKPGDDFRPASSPSLPDRIRRQRYQRPFPAGFAGTGPFRASEVSGGRRGLGVAMRMRPSQLSQPQKPMQVLMASRVANLAWKAADTAGIA